MHANGTVSVSGTIGDRDFALSLLDHARDAIGRQIPRKGEIYMPNRDVDLSPNPGLREMGDLHPNERGDA
jgi:hypothetical protein